VAQKVLLVLNEKAGSFDPDFRDQFVAKVPDGKVGSVDDISAEDWDLVIAAGGDGTVRQVVNGLLKSELDAALGIVPLGTANVIAHALGLPKDPKEALEIALGPEAQRLDVGLCHEEAFLLGCGLGLAERFVTHTGDEEKAHLGPIAYLKRLLAERDAPKVEFCIESSKGVLRMQGVGLVVANLAQLGTQVKPVEDVSPVDGELGLIILKRARLIDLLRLGFRSLFGNAADDAALDYFSTSKCRISSEPKVPIQIDGDKVDQTSPFQFDLLPHRLAVKVPSPASSDAEDL